MRDRGRPQADVCPLLTCTVWVPRCEVVSRRGWPPGAGGGQAQARGQELRGAGRGRHRIQGATDQACALTGSVPTCTPVVSILLPDLKLQSCLNVKILTCCSSTSPPTRKSEASMAAAGRGSSSIVTLSDSRLMRYRSRYQVLTQ